MGFVESGKAFEVCSISKGRGDSSLLSSQFFSAVMDSREKTSVVFLLAKHSVLQIISSDRALTGDRLSSIIEFVLDRNLS